VTLFLDRKLNRKIIRRKRKYAVGIHTSIQVSETRPSLTSLPIVYRVSRQFTFHMYNHYSGKDDYKYCTGYSDREKNDRCTRMEKLCLSLQTKRISQTLINNPLIGIVNRNRSILLNNKCDCQLTAIKLTGIKTGLILLSREDSIDSALLHHFGFAFRKCLIFAFLAIAKSLKPTSDGRRQCNKRGIFDDERRLGIIDAGITFPIRRGIANTFNVNLLVGYFCVGPDFFTHTHNTNCFFYCIDIALFSSLIR